MLPLLRFSPVHRISLSMHLPRLVISGLSGGSGKTLLSLGLTRAPVSYTHLTLPTNSKV